MVLSAICFGSLGLLGKLGSREHLPIPTLLGLRFSLAAGVLAALAVMRGETLRLRRRHALGATLMGLLYVGQASCYFGSLRTVPAAVTSILLYVYPAIVVVLARVLHAEPLTRRRLLAVALAVGGTVLVAGPAPTGSLDAVGVALGLGSAVVYSTYILAGPGLVGGAPAVPVTTWVTATAGIAFLAAGAVSGQLTRPSAGGWAVVGSLALVGTVGGATLFLAGLARVGPGRAAVISTLEPVSTAALAAIGLGETVSAETGAGGLAVLAAAWLAGREAPGTPVRE